MWFFYWAFNKVRCCISVEAIDLLGTIRVDAQSSGEHFCARLGRRYVAASLFAAGDALRNPSEWRL